MLELDSPQNSGYIVHTSHRLQVSVPSSGLTSCLIYVMQWALASYCLRASDLEAML